MKRKIVLSFVLAVALALATSGMAMADLIAGWNYNAYTADNKTTGSATDGPSSPQLPYADMGALIGVARQVHSGSLVYWGYNDGTNGSGQDYDWVNDPAGNEPSAPADDRRYRFTTNGSNDGLRWNVNTTGYEDITVSLGMFTGMDILSTNNNRRFYIGYSTDGTNFTDTEYTYAGSSNWLELTLNLSLIELADNNPNFAIHLISGSTNNTNLRLTTDYVQVEGTQQQVVPIPAAAWLLGSGLLGLVAIRRRIKK